MTNYCTAWPDRIGSWDYGHCCQAHDIAYLSDAPRIPADIELAQCVVEATGQHWLAFIMLVGVVALGGIYRAWGRWKRRR